MLTSSTALGGDVDAYPLAAQVVDGDAGGGAPAEGVKDHVALVAAGLDDALQQGQGVLGGVAGAFLGPDGLVSKVGLRHGGLLTFHVALQSKRRPLRNGRRRL